MAKLTRWALGILLARDVNGTYVYWQGMFTVGDEIHVWKKQ